EKGSDSIHELLYRLSAVASKPGSIADLSSSVREKVEVGSESVHKRLEHMTFIDKSGDSDGSGLEALVSSTAENSNISALITDIS
ncbi:methyl-accepting chemotaxis protein, partial [Bacillus paralicheniformis]|nr:methyl-accepting chemotaxis protein [Bacillus paralicheniformis]